MKVKINGIEKHFRTVWMEGSSVYMINQSLLPHRFKIFKARTYLDTVEAIKNMTVRGAGANGAAAGYAMAQAAIECRGLDNIDAALYVLEAEKSIKNARPTAQNLFYAVDRVCDAIHKQRADSLDAIIAFAVMEAGLIANEDVIACRKIGMFGNELIRDGMRILTHCNAGWLAFVDYGSALSPIYAAKAAGKKVFVYADETRPVLQGARLTAWELLNEGIEHRVICDNMAGSFMRKGLVDIIFVGADRIAMNGAVANKIGTYPLAVLAKENEVPFYVCAPSSTIDTECMTGEMIPIEERSEDEVHWVPGKTKSGRRTRARITPEGSKALNPAFDVTFSRYITGIITENGIFEASEEGMKLAVELARRYRS